MICVIRNILQREQISYVFKEHTAKHQLGWYEICFQKTDSTIHMFSCWFNSTSIGKTPSSLGTRQIRLDTVTPYDIGAYRRVQKYCKSDMKLLTEQSLKAIENTFTSEIINKIKISHLEEENIEIETSVRFDPVLILYFKVIQNKCVLGHIQYHNGNFTPIGIFDSRILWCIQKLKEAFESEQRLYRLCLTESN